MIPEQTESPKEGKKMRCVFSVTFPDELESNLARAKLLVMMRCNQDAACILNMLIKKYPANAMVTFIIGLMFYYQGRIEESISIFERSILADDNLEEARTFKKKAEEISLALHQSKYWNFAQNKQ